MNKCIMNPAEQYERYKAFIKSTDENVKSQENKDKTGSNRESDIMRDSIPDDFPEEIVADKDYKRSSQKNHLNLKK